MRNALLILTLAILSGCSSTQALKVNYPTPPSELMVQPTEPMEIPDNVNIDLKTITEYSTKNNLIAYQNRIQLQELQSWIRQQMELYNSK